MPGHSARSVILHLALKGLVGSDPIAVMSLQPDMHGLSINAPVQLSKPMVTDKWMHLSQQHHEG